MAGMAATRCKSSAFGFAGKREKGKGKSSFAARVMFVVTAASAVTAARKPPLVRLLDRVMHHHVVHRDSGFGSNTPVA
jgi:hypothetical protein